MAQVFSRKSNSIARAILVGGLLLFVGAGVAGDVYKWSPWQTQVGVPVEQAVPFSHRHHVGELGLDCRYCHGSVTRAASAGMPSTHTCMTCHSQIWQDAAMLAPVRESYARGEPLRWNRVYRLPKYVYFDHSIHVNQGVGCTTCHGAIDQMPLTWKAGAFFMKDCLACHREPEKYLRPKDAVFDVHWEAPPDQLARGAALAEEYHIPKARLTDCNTCHR